MTFAFCSIFHFRASQKSNSWSFTNSPIRIPWIQQNWPTVYSVYATKIPKGILISENSSWRSASHLQSKSKWTHSFHLDAISHPKSLDFFATASAESSDNVEGAKRIENVLKKSVSQFPFHLPPNFPFTYNQLNESIFCLTKQPSLFLMCFFLAGFLPTKSFEQSLGFGTSKGRDICNQVNGSKVWVDGIKEKFRYGLAGTF